MAATTAIIPNSTIQISGLMEIMVFTMTDTRINTEISTMTHICPEEENTEIMATGDTGITHQVSTAEEMCRYFMIKTHMNMRKITFMKMTMTDIDTEVEEGELKTYMTTIS